jgi:hypothetical protein
MKSDANQRSLRTARKLAVGEPQRYPITSCIKDFNGENMDTMTKGTADS